MNANHFLYLVFACTGIPSAWGQDVLMVDNPAHLDHPERSLELSASLFAADDMVPVNHFSDDPWPANYHARSGSNLAVANDRVSLGERRGNWSVAYFQRQDWYLKANQDTVHADYLNQTGQLTSQAGNYNVDYSLRGYSADGLRFGLSKAFAAAESGEGSWGVALALLHGQDVRMETANGSLVNTMAGSNSTGTLTGGRELFNTRLHSVAVASSLNDFVAPSESIPGGWGYTLDLGMQWRYRNGATFSLAVNDLFGRIRWDRVPLLKQRFDAETVNGTLQNINPNGSGQAASSYRSLTLNLKPKLRVAGDYPVGNATLMASAEEMDGELFPQLGVNYLIAENWRVGLEYETRFGSAEISLRHPDFYLALSTQKLNFGESRALGFSAGLNYAF